MKADDSARRWNFNLILYAEKARYHAMDLIQIQSSIVKCSPVGTANELIGSSFPCFRLRCVTRQRHTIPQRRDDDAWARGNSMNFPSSLAEQ